MNCEFSWIHEGLVFIGGFAAGSIGLLVALALVFNIGEYETHDRDKDY